MNRSNVIECVNRTCPVGWYDGMKSECAYCHNVNNSFTLLQVNVYNVLKAVAQQVVLVHYRM